MLVMQSYPPYRAVIVRAISGFKFEKDGSLWKPTVKEVKSGSWNLVYLVGYVTSLACDETRPIIETGYWDLEGHVVERSLMRLRPLHMYKGKNAYFRSRQVTSPTFYRLEY
jgi:hypothetical protein